MIIKSKIITIIALTIILIVGTTTAILLRMQTSKMLNAKINDTVFLGSIIESSIENAMKDGNTEEVTKIINNIGKNKEILSLRILSTDGSILRSMDNSEIGFKSKIFISSPFNEISQKPALVDDKTINYFKNIPNKTECYGCHNSGNKVIGVIQIKHDISRSLATMLSMKKIMIFASIAIVLIVSLILSLLFTNLVVKPLKTLLTTIHDIESGNLNATVDIERNDEIGTIGTAFNKMISEINNLYKKNLNKEKELSKIKVELEHKNKVEDLNSQLEHKIKELETANKAITSLSKELKGKNIALENAVERLKKINEIGQILTSIIETEELMKIIIRTTAELMNAEKVILHLNNVKKPSMTIQYLRGIGIEKLNDFSLEFNPSHADILKLGKPLLTSKTADNMTDNSKLNSQIGVPLKMKGQVIGSIMLENKADGSIFTKDELDLLTTLSSQAMVAIDNAWLYEKIKSNYFDTIQSFINALEANDRFAKGHSERVKLLSLELGRHIGLDYRELEVMEHASILHDIGKIGIDSFILQKQGKLTPKEFSIIKEHPLIGEEILGPIGTLDDVRQTIIQHHERYDGKGYPYGLRGNEISLKARILSVVDTFDAMMTDRPYRSSFSLHVSQEELRANAGTQFDPYVVDAFIELLDLKGEELLVKIGYDTLQTAN